MDFGHCNLPWSPPVNFKTVSSKIGRNDECTCVGVLTVTPRDRKISAIKIGEKEGCDGEHEITKSKIPSGKLIGSKFCVDVVAEQPG